MEIIIKQEKQIVKNLTNNLEEFLLILLKNSSKINNVNNANNLNNFIDKIRLLNKSIVNINNEINDVIIDLKNNNFDITDELSYRLDQEEKTIKMISDLSPLILLYIMNQNN